MKTIKSFAQQKSTIQKLELELGNLRTEFEQYKRESVKWSAEDVLGIAKRDGIECSEEQAQEILELMISKHDAELGITWITIECYLENI